jgi:hypothetical protein
MDPKVTLRFRHSSNDLFLARQETVCNFCFVFQSEIVATKSYLDRKGRLAQLNIIIQNDFLFWFQKEKELFERSTPSQRQVKPLFLVFLQLSHSKKNQKEETRQRERERGRVVGEGERERARNAKQRGAHLPTPTL